MRAVVQRVTDADVSVENQVKGSIGRGFVVLLGVEEGDNETDADYIAEKVSGLRVFDDSEGKMNLSVTDIGGEILSVSQFTLLADARKGRRPSFIRAAQPEEANRLYEYFNEKVREKGVTVAEGVFRADMLVRINNDGPVTILLDSRKLF
ncbi:MAG: D-aminoacyl-tRNA deacylase [Firmicutes bacterium]|nr:D-aminoacyl-tRNA deacylase [Bacillota bacterium]MDY5771035.1 D-aminoacyl-tRNA deacylase [Anaerovoracaceae bacterium]